jgi:hypothetical protein
MVLKWLFRTKTSLTLRTFNENSTSFNDLNNDLLLEIFDYLSFNDILLSFGNINPRFDKLIENYPYCLDLRSYQHLPNHIRSLKITGSYQLSILFSFQHSQLSSLRAISLSNLRPQEVHDVLNYVPCKQLEYIYLGICALNGRLSETKTISSIQQEILALSQYRLGHCHLKDKLCCAVNDLPETLFALEYLQLVGCRDFCILSKLLSRMPNLKHIQVSTIEMTQNPLVSNLCHITYVSLRPHLTCSAKELTNFLRKCCPHVKKLIVEIYIYKSEQPHLRVNKHQWLTIFPYRLRYFYWKSIPSPSIHPLCINADQPALPLREQLLLIFSDIQEYYCEVIIDPQLINTWKKKE